MALTLAQILALPTQTRPRLIKASDRGGAIYQIEEGAAGSTATPVIPNNNDARSVMGLGSGDSVSFGALTVAGNALQVTGASAINQDLRTTASPTWAGINNTPIGAGGASTGVFTNVSATGNLTVGNAIIVTGASSVIGRSGNGGWRFPGNGQASLFQTDGTTPGALTVGSGAFSGPVTITDTTDSTSPITGSFVTAGGVGLGGNLRGGASLYAFPAGSLGWTGGSRIFNPSGVIAFRNGSNSADVSFTAANATLSGSLSLPRTVIPPGTTGAQTINTATGRVRFAAGATTLVVTNSLATTASNIVPVVEGNDGTATSARIALAAGSFTIRLNSPATAETTVSFTITNP